MLQYAKTGVLGFSAEIEQKGDEKELFLMLRRLCFKVTSEQYAESSKNRITQLARFPCSSIFTASSKEPAGVTFPELTKKISSAFSMVLSL